MKHTKYYLELYFINDKIINRKRTQKQERYFSVGTVLSYRNGTFLQERYFPAGTVLSHEVCRLYSTVRPKNTVRGFLPGTILRKGIFPRPCGAIVPAQYYLYSS